MDSSSAKKAEIARNSYSTLLQRLRDETSQTEVARELGKHKATVNRLVNVHAAPVLALCAQAGLKLVDIDAEFFDEEELRALRTLAGRGLSTIGPQKKDKNE